MENKKTVLELFNQAFSEINSLVDKDISYKEFTRLEKLERLKYYKYISQLEKLTFSQSAILKFYKF